MKKTLLLRIEEIILAALILLNLLEFTSALSAEWSYIKKIISYTILGYLLYKASLSSVFYGEKNENFDFLLVFSYFLLAFKNVFIISLQAVENATFFKPFFFLLIQYGPVFEIITFYLGIVLMAILAGYSGKNFKIKNPSLMGVIREKNKETKIQKILVSYLVFLAFFLFIFNLSFEWLAIAVDAPLISLAFFGYIFLAWKKHHLDTESTLFKIGNYGERFYEYFISHFKYKDKFLLGISGMLILHMLTDIGVFLIPYVTGLKNELYIPIFAEGHDSLWVLASSIYSNMLQRSLLYFHYVVATVGYALTMVLPAIMWHNLYFKKQFHINNVILSLFFAGITAFAFSPIYNISPLKPEFFVGVDITTTAISINPVPALVVSLFVFFAVLFFCRTKARKPLIFFANLTSTVFFLWYVISFFLSSTNWYSNAAVNLIQTPHVMIGIHFFIFLMLTIIFYVGGYYLFLRSLLKHRVTI